MYLWLLGSLYWLVVFVVGLVVCLVGWLAGLPFVLTLCGLGMIVDFGCVDWLVLVALWWLAVVGCCCV